jgi:hypothetical protein
MPLTVTIDLLGPFFIVAIVFRVMNGLEKQSPIIKTLKHFKHSCLKF